MVLAPKLSPGDLIGALEAGKFYASSGVFLNSISTDSQGLKFEIRPEDGVTYTVEFIGTNGYDPTSEPTPGKEGREIAATRQYSADIRTVFKTMQDRWQNTSSRGTYSTFVASGLFQVAPQSLGRWRRRLTPGSSRYSARPPWSARINIPRD